MGNVGEFAVKHEAQKFSFGDYWNIDIVECKQRVWMQFSLMAKMHTDRFGLRKFETIFVAPCLKIIKAPLQLSLDGAHLARPAACQKIIHIQGALNPCREARHDTINFEAKQRHR
jgi:hypothetical protein